MLYLSRRINNTVMNFYRRGSLSALVLCSPVSSFINQRSEPFVPSNGLSYQHREMSTSRIDRELMKLNLSSYNQKGDEDINRRSSEYPSFRKGNPIQVEVARFGPLGASVEIVAKSHNSNELIPEDEEPLGYGLILQREIGYFRASRGGLDVVVGEILPAYVDWVRDDGKVDISLRKPGGKGKADDLGAIIMTKLKESGGEIPVGDKSSPSDINIAFPGASKASFKRAVAALYKKRMVEPGPNSTRLL